MLDSNAIKSLVDVQEPKLIEYRNYLHENPELSFKEVNTSRFVKDKMKEFGIPVLDRFSGTSVVAELDSGVPGPAVMFRADFDALPIQEACEWEHKSRNPGVMHACGHDMHCANMLSFAEILSQHPELLKKGKIRFLFQAAEELIPGGAISLVKEGICDDIDYVFAMHSGSNPCGSIILTRNHASMNIGTWLVKVQGKGGHTGSPHLAHDPLAALVDIALAVERIAPDRLDPTRTNIISVSGIHAGKTEALNVIPDTGYVGGSVRCLYEEDRKYSFDLIQQYSRSICAMHGCTCEFEILTGYPGLVNDDNCADHVLQAAKLLNISVIDPGPDPGGEDFAYYQTKKPSAYFKVGVANADKPEVSVKHHSPNFFIDETGMRTALEMFLALADQFCG